MPPILKYLIMQTTPTVGDLGAPHNPNTRCQIRFPEEPPASRTTDRGNGGLSWGTTVGDGDLEVSPSKGVQHFRMAKQTLVPRLAYVSLIPLP